MNNSIKIVLLFAGLTLLFSCNTPSRKESPKSDKSPDKVKIEYIAHASFLLSYNDYTLLLDPYADSVWISYLFPRDIEADAIFSTHPHYDHDGGLFRELNPYWEGHIPFFQDQGKYKKGGFEITGVKGKHNGPYGKEFGQKNTIFVFEAGGLRIAHWGDNEAINDSTAAALSNIDILLFPIDDTNHILDTEETRQTISTINPKVVVPIHYRIDELEPTEGKPKNLGGISEFITNNDNAKKLNSHKIELSPTDLPASLEYWIFEHAPYVKRPE